MLFVPSKPAEQTHWFLVKADKPSHSEGTSHAFYGTIFKDASGCRDASVITQFGPWTFFYASECTRGTVLENK